MQPDGSPRFTQVLRWDGDPNALFYEVTVQTANGQAVSVSRPEQPVLRLNLRPGEYRYRIVLYNLLRRPEVTLPWQELTVLRAEFPQISGSEPKMWFLEDLKPLLELAGENLIPGATVTLRHDGGPEAPLTGTEARRDGTSKVSFEFSPEGFGAGEYSLEMKNPGGLSVTYPHALLIRHMLPAPAGLQPASGTTYGPKELRGMSFIRFSWDPVPEAVRYVFSIYGAADAKPVVRVEQLTGTSYLLDDLSVLDRGEFRWTVEPHGRDEVRGDIPPVAPAESRFAIDLPQLREPSVQPGDVFYGR